MTLFIALTVMGSVVLLDEAFGLMQVIGTILIGVGIFTIVQANEGVPDAGTAPAAPVRRAATTVRGRIAELTSGRVVRGYLLIAFVAVLWAIATIWLAMGRDELSSLAAASLRTPAGAAAVLVFAMATTPRALVRPFTEPRNLAAIIAVGIVGTAMGSLAYVYAVGEAGAARATVLSSVSPLMALPLSVLFLREQLSVKILTGTAVCVAGILVVVSGS
jgi:drug/metabolite transporter (DMT)-like permease